MQQQSLAAQVVQQALSHYSLRPPLPPKLQLWSPAPDADNKGVLKLVRSAAGQVMTQAWSLGMHFVNSIVCFFELYLWGSYPS